MSSVVVVVVVVVVVYVVGSSYGCREILSGMTWEQPIGNTPRAQHPSHDWLRFVCATVVETATMIALHGRHLVQPRRSLGDKVPYSGA